jgi:hypothetical protein
MTSDRIAEAMGTSVKMLLSHYKHGTIEETRRYLDVRGLLLPASNVQQQHHRSLGIMGTDDLIQGDWRRKQVVLAPDGQLIIASE